MPIKVSAYNVTGFFDAIKTLTDSDKVAEKVAERGAEIARENYGKRHVVVSVERVDDADYKIVARGHNVAFEEYGTGVYARGSYAAETENEGQLPTGPITFRTSNGMVHTTQGWEYYYPSEAKDLVNGKYGWWIKRGVFVTGSPAKAHLWKAGKRLREELQKKNLMDIMGSDKNNV